LGSPKKKGLVGKSPVESNEPKAEGKKDNASEISTLGDSTHPLMSVVAALIIPLLVK
jgi:hypothetical protein